MTTSRDYGHVPGIYDICIVPSGAGLPARSRFGEGRAGASAPLAPRISSGARSRLSSPRGSGLFVAPSGAGRAHPRPWLAQRCAARGRGLVAGEAARSCFCLLFPVRMVGLAGPNQPQARRAGGIARGRALGRILMRLPESMHFYTSRILLQMTLACVFLIFFGGGSV